MKTRVLEICKERGISLSELAEKIGVKQPNLTSSLNNNPTLNTLKAVADNLNVNISDLFVKEEKGINGYLELNGEVRKITSVADLLPVTGTFGIKSYTNFKVCKKDLKDFIMKSLKAKDCDSFSGILEGIMMFSLSHCPDQEDGQFILSSYSSERKPITIRFSELEYSDGEGNIDVDYLLSMMWAEIVGSIDESKDYTDKELESKEVL